MNWTTTLLALLHLLVPIYWLGGDLGAFYSSGLLADPRRTPAERMLALTILNNIDMAPRTALILALPTGLSLAVGKGWLAFSPGWIALLWAGSLVWLALAWAVHLRHGPQGAGLKRADLMLRYVLLAGLAGAGTAGLMGALPLPLFIAGKLIVLSICIGIGLAVRRQLVPLFPAIIAMKAHGPTNSTDAAITAVLARTKATVVLLWAMVLIASALGLGKPV